MSAIEQCRSGGAWTCLRCEPASRFQIAYNSARNRTLPKVPASSRAALARGASGLSAADEYYILVSPPAPIAELAYQNKAVIYGFVVRRCFPRLC